jgi:hypothetical protein
VIRLLTAALRAFVAHLEWKQRNYIYELEDAIDELATDGSPAAKLRIERLAKRLKRERTLRPADSDSD